MCSRSQSVHSPRYRRPRLYRPRPPRCRRRVATHSTTTNQCCYSPLTTPYPYLLLLHSCVVAAPPLPLCYCCYCYCSCSAQLGQIGHTPNPHPHPSSLAASNSSSSAPVLPPASQTSRPRTLSSAPLAHSTSSKHQPHLTRPDQAPTQLQHSSPLAVLHAYAYCAARVLAACCLRACLCVVRRYASLQAVACCLLCAVVTTAPPTQLDLSSASAPCRPPAPLSKHPSPWPTSTTRSSVLCVTRMAAIAARDASA
jgi:hypothetical protein